MELEPVSLAEARACVGGSGSTGEGTEAQETGGLGETPTGWLP